ncbi:MAG TPA: cell wall hydrolase [bacterium]|nr:cell wall hydrolase [bacterium]
MRWLLTLFLIGVPLTFLGQTYEQQAVAAVLMGEAWSEGVLGMTAVAEVIRQRAVEKSRTPLQIVSAHRGKFHAFSCLNGTTLDLLIAKFSPEPSFRLALEIVQKTCLDSNEESPGLTKAATHYTLATERPYWAEGQHPVAIIGRHAFYKLKHY